MKDTQESDRQIDEVIETLRHKAKVIERYRDKKTEQRDMDKEIEYRETERQRDGAKETKEINEETETDDGNIITSYW